LRARLLALARRRKAGEGLGFWERRGKRGARGFYR
jgi:hypothetical protein